MGSPIGILLDAWIYVHIFVVVIVVVDLCRQK
jgi:hypothetical protein